MTPSIESIHDNGEHMPCLIDVCPSNNGAPVKMWLCGYFSSNMKIIQTPYDLIKCNVRPLMTLIKCKKNLNFFI